MSNKRKRKPHRTTPARPTAEQNKGKRQKKKVEPFPMRIGTMMRHGLDGIRREPVALLVGSLLPVIGTLPFQFPAAAAFDDGRTTAGITFTIVGMMVGGALAYPWCHYALRTAREETIDLAAPFRDWDRFVPMLVASFWFWAGMLLAFQFQILGGLPALAIVMAYAFFGFVIDERHDQSGLKALGTSVRITEGRRFALLGIVCLYAFIWIFVVIVGVAIAGGLGLTGPALGVRLASHGLRIGRQWRRDEQNEQRQKQSHRFHGDTLL